jgi:uncharacterized protein YhaN
MRLDALNLIAYGPFTGRRLDFVRPFTIAYGLNEAGKSSALRALLDGLYGISNQTSDSFIHPYQNLRIGVEISSEGGGLHFIRRKGRVQTLRAIDDSTVIDDSILERALNGIRRDTFASMFGISHAALVEGGRALAEGQGEVGQLLFVSAAGLAGMQATLARLEEQAGELYAPRATSKAIHRCIRELRDAEQRLKESQIVLSRFQENQKALEQLAKDIGDTEAQVEVARREAERLGRIKGVLPTISDRKQAEIELAQIDGGNPLPSDYGDRFEEVQRRLRAARDGEAEYSRELIRLAEAMAQLHVPEDLLAAGEQIRALFERKSAIQKSRQDCARRAAELAQVNLSLLDQVQKLGPGMKREDAATLEPGFLIRSRVQELAPVALRLEADRDALARGLQDARRKLADYDTQITNLPSVPDTTLLAATVERARRELDVRRTRDLRVKAATTESAIGVALRSLSPWNGTAEELAGIPTPPAETVEEFREAFQAAAADERAAREKLVDAERQLAEAQGDRERIVALESVPTMRELASARELRESGWGAVKSLWKLGDAAREREFLSRTGHSDLASAYEGAVAGADHVADRIRDNAQRVEQLAALDADIAKLTRRKAGADVAVCSAVQNLDAARERWIRAWVGCGIVPESPSAMLTWLRRRAGIAEQVETLRELRQELGALEEAESGIAADLRRLVSADVAGAAGGAADLLAVAECVLAEAAKTRERRQALTGSREAQRYEIERIEREIGDAAARLEDWRRNWASTLQSAGLPLDLSPAAAENYLNSVRDVVANWNKAKDLEHRIETMQADAGEFAGGVRSLVVRLNPALSGLEPDAAIVQLHDALIEAQQDRKLLQQDGVRQRDLEQKRDVAAQAAARHNAELEQLCREAAAADAGAARERWAVSRRCRELENRIAELDERLRLVSAGKTIPEFLAEASAVDADSIPGELEEIRSRIASVREQRAALEEKRRSLDAEALAMRGGDTAASAAQQISGLVGRLAGDVEQYVRLRTATFVIRKAIERYRERNQGPVLERAARIFADLTCGSFSSLRVESDEGAATLVGLRPAGDAVRLEGMSDGTRDQLYLALRIASLEHYFSSHAPAPFIVDDVLLNFDDERAAMALRALGALSEKTQVIFFTHHRRLVELAAGCTDAAVCEL